MSASSSRFNLIDEAWIPVRKLSGERVELGIRDTLIQATHIATIEDASPLVTASLHRFLLAVLYRALEGPTDIDQAKAWFRSGLPAERIDAYLERWRDRFWLFDETHPFFQIPDFEPNAWRAWTVLAAEHNADNAKVLFDHVDVTRPGGVPAASAARWLLAAQSFAVSAGKSELAHTGTAPSATAAMILPLGRQLEDTLLMSLVPQGRLVIADDLPIWERDPESPLSLKGGIARAIAGYADRYTWRTRSVRLRGDEHGDVRTLAFASGVEYEPKDGIDPMLGYRVDESNGKMPLQFRDRGLWRDFDSLLPDAAKLAPEVVEHATTLTRMDGSRFPRAILALGQLNRKAKIEFWRLERFALPEALLGERSIRAEVKQLLFDGETNEEELRRALISFARDVLGRGERVPDKDDIKRFVEKNSATAMYWSMLEAAFHEVLLSYTAECRTDLIRLDWLITVRAALRQAWALHAGSASISDAWAIRALARAGAIIVKQIGELNEEIHKYEMYVQSRGEIA
jgi:CRISPR system Cascade subunit CasA